MSFGPAKVCPSSNVNPPLILSNATASMPLMMSNPPAEFTTVPMAWTTCGSLASSATILSGMVTELKLITLPFGGLKRISAPTPAWRLRESSIKPLLRPTIVRISVTGTAISRILSNVRAGLCRTFSQTSFTIIFAHRDQGRKARSPVVAFPPAGPAQTARQSWPYSFSYRSRPLPRHSRLSGG